MIRSGLNVPTPAMPMPDFAVPYAAPAPGCGCGGGEYYIWISTVDIDSLGSITYIRISSGLEGLILDLRIWDNWFGGLTDCKCDSPLVGGCLVYENLGQLTEWTYHAEERCEFRREL